MSSKKNSNNNQNTKTKKRTTKKKRNWKEYNESLVRRGEIMFDTNFLLNWRAELTKMNNAKKGAKYLYPNSLILLLSTVHVYLLAYRQMEGFLKIMSKNIPRLTEIPDYTTMWWRIARTKVELNPTITNPNGKELITIAVDSTGIKVSNRGERIRDKWNQKRKGFIKIHVGVNIRTKQIISMEVTKENIGDGKMLRPLIQQQQQQHQQQKQNIIIRVIADCAYDSKDNFSYLHRMGMTPVIKVRKNSSDKTNNNCIPRKLVVVEQLKDVRKWKRKYKYGMSWIAESTFSSIKRTFGEYVKSVKWNNIVNELLVKAYLYNMFMKVISV